MDRIVQRHRRLFAYDDWANRETLAALDSGGPTPESALKGEVVSTWLRGRRIWGRDDGFGEPCGRLLRARTRAAEGEP